MLSSSLQKFTTATPFCSFVLAVSLAIFVSADPLSISVPSTALGHNVVQPNFLGVSLELSFMDEYFGNDASTIPSTIINYLSAIRGRTGNFPLRLRVGGNSMDSSVYVPELATPMLQNATTAANANNQPVNYGPMLWKVMKKVADDVGGAKYLIGLSLLDPNNPNVPVIAGAAEQTLEDALDGYLLGNEPDLYTAHQQRPDIKNYTTDIYINEFRTVADRLANTSAGNLLNLKNLGGPTVCCVWNLDVLLQGGYLAAFHGILKYISLQHYPQNNCFDHYQYGIPYYIQHANVVGLTSWQSPAIALLQSNTSANPQLIMSEFNSASCGGVPTISDTFAVGTLWTVDYALQMAAVGFSAAYLHTRERGISYNLFTPPDGPNGNPGNWVTNPPYYALIATAEALQTTDGVGSVVVDLNIANSKTDKKATVAGYAVYDSKGSAVEQIVLFNYANVSNFPDPSAATATFALPASAFSAMKKTEIPVKFLSASGLTEKYNIAWGGQSLIGIGNGIFQDNNATWAIPNQQLDCTNGCSVSVPAAAMAVVFAGGTNEINIHGPQGNMAQSSFIVNPALVALGVIGSLSIIAL
ncbi:hypothetical protein H2248_006522 [Termitomyces sp. 'cryptogamus']|nr:hypothetical protein H2248_006522 [Termitomyces sp. 'cryptogamus']